MPGTAQQLTEDIERRKRELVENYNQGYLLQSSLMIKLSQELDELIVAYLSLHAMAGK